MDIKIGQVWHDKDKRRDTTITVTDVFESDSEGVVALAVNHKTNEEKEYKAERLLKRWELVTEPPALDKELEALVNRSLTREQWLTDAVELLTPLFAELDLDDVVEVPEVRVSVGWPGGRGPKSSVVGQCWKKSTAEDNVSQIFISPVVDDPVAVLATLLHELVHASDDGASGHRGHFKRVSAALGYHPKFTNATVNGKPNGSEELTSILTEISEKLGPYPHSAIKPQDKPQVQKTFMRKLTPDVSCHECPDGYKLRMTEKWLEEVGAPLCPHGIEMVED